MRNRYHQPPRQNYVREDLDRARAGSRQLGGVDLEGANLRGAFLSRVDLGGANLEIADLSGANLSHSELSDANLSGAILEDADLSHSFIQTANLRNANLRNANLRNADLSRSTNMTGADLTGADLTGAILLSVILDGIIYDDSTIWPSGFAPPPPARSNGRRRNSTPQDLDRALAGDKNLERADLSGADLIKADLTGADLTGADLIKANFTGANLTGADLSRARLIRADLPRAVLRGANLSGANLLDADLRFADLTGADLTDAMFLGDANLSFIIYDETTIWPARFTLPPYARNDYFLARPHTPPPARSNGPRRNSTNTGADITAAFGSLAAGISDGAIAKGLEYALQGRDKEAEDWLWRYGLDKLSPRGLEEMLKVLGKARLAPGASIRDANVQAYIRNSLVPWYRAQIERTSRIR